MSNQENQQTYPFSEDIQKRLVAMLLGDFAGFIQHCEVVKPEFFDNPILRDLSGLIYGFYKKYQRLPREDEFIDAVGIHLSENPRLPDVEFGKVTAEVINLVAAGDFAYVKDRAKDFARYQAIKNAVVESVSIVQRRTNYEEILGKVRAALAIGEEHADLGTFYLESMEERLAERALGRTRSALAIPTAIRGIDQVLGGGLAKGELGVAMGPYKRGKTILSVNFAVGALYRGYNVAHYIMEGSEDRLQDMYDSRLSNVDRAHLQIRAEEVREALVMFKSAPSNGRLVLKHFPALSCTPFKVEAHLAKLRLAGFVPSMLILDYLGLMLPTQKMSGEVDRYVSFGQITKEVLSLAQRGNYAVWLLHQTVRGSRTKEIVDLEDSADSVEPMRDADIILTLNQTQAESEMVPSRMRIFLAGGREVPDRRMATVLVDKEKSHIFDVEVGE